MTVKIDGSTGVDKVQPLSVEQEDLKWVPPFTREYVSAEQAITLGATINLINALGAMPKLVQISLICKTAEFGATVGEEASVARDANNGSWGVELFRTSANLRLVVGGSGIYIIRDTGVVTPITPANWRLIVRAWV